MKRIDPTQYRHFVVTGVLLINGCPVEVFTPGHADDLPTGEDEKWVFAERVRRRIGANWQDPHARWSELAVIEFAPPSEMYELEPGEEW